MRIFVFILIVFILFWIDIWSKIYFENLLWDNTFYLIWDFLYLDLVKNPWIAFWIDIFNSITLNILTFIFIFFLLYYYFSEEFAKSNIFIDIWFMLIIWWAFWNFYERLVYSEVIDFIWIKYFSIFNFADTFLTIWFIIYILWFYYFKPSVKWIN